MSNTPSATVLRVLSNYADDPASYKAMTAAAETVTRKIRESIHRSLKSAVTHGTTDTIHVPTTAILLEPLASIARHCPDREIEELHCDLQSIAYVEIRDTLQRLCKLTVTVTAD